VRPFRKPLSERSALVLARALTGGIGALAVLVALWLPSCNVKSLWDASNALIGLVGSGLSGLFLLGIFTRRAHGIGALLGVAASAAVLAWVQTQTDVHFFLYAAIGILTCVGVGYAASLLIPYPRKNLANLTVFTREDRTP
jgi:solute:Na+ symporter, SSS family